MTRSALFLLALAATAAGQSPRKKAVAMPFGLRYGEYTFGAWFGIPITVGSQTFDLSISTSLSQSWIPSKSMCNGDSNVTRCVEELGGTFDTGKSSTWKADPAQTGVKIEKELLEGYYNSTTAPKLMVQSGNGKKLLAMEGTGDVGKDLITLEANTGTFSMGDQTIGLITSGNKALMANGYLSLQQMALSLYAGEYTASPTFHLFHGTSSFSNDSVLDITGRDYGGYLLIFGGYDSGNFNLNTSQQYPLIETNFSTGAISLDATEKSIALPASEGVSYGMQVMLEDIVYRWTIGGGTDNSLLASSRLAIIDSTTPWIWLPKSAYDSLIALSGATWNETYSSYTFPYCGGGEGCTDTQGRAYFSAMLDFKFEQMNGDKLSLNFWDYLTEQYLPYNGSYVYMVPIKELPEDAPIILGRPFLAGVHLWVDYAEKYWAMAQGNTTLQNQLRPSIITWDRDSHPPITNTSILVQRPSKDEVSSGSGSGSGSVSNKPDEKDRSSSALGVGAIAGIAGGGGVLLIGLAIVAFCLIRRKKGKPTDKPNRPESMIELHSNDVPNVAELPQAGPPNQGQFNKPPSQGQFNNAYEMAQQSSYYKPQELPSSGSYPVPPPPAAAPHEMPQSSYYKPQELPNSGPYQMPPPPGAPPPQQYQQGFPSPVSPAGQAYHYPPPPPQQQQGMYPPPPPTYDMGQGGPIYYEMDANRGGY